MKTLLVMGLFILSFKTSFSQKWIIIRDKSNNKPIENVYCETSNHSVLVSNQEGEIQIPFQSEFIILSHIGFVTKKINSEELKENQIIYLKTKLFELNETIVLPTAKAEEIIKKASQHQLDNYDKNFVRDFHINLTGKRNSTKILGLTSNIRISRINKEESYWIDNSSLINRDYFLNKKTFENNVFLSPIAIFSGYFIRNYSFFKRFKAYNYKIENNTSNTFIISFEPKSNEKFSYRGTIEISKIDFAVKYFSAELLPNPKNIRKTIITTNKKSDAYLFVKENFEFEFEKEGNSYILTKGLYVNETNQINSLVIPPNPKFNFEIYLTKIPNQVNMNKIIDIRTLKILN